LIGNTPLLELTNFNRNNGSLAKIIAKLDHLILQQCKRQDRICNDDAARKQGILDKDSTIIEPQW